MFTQLKELLVTNPDTKFRFETSDLRRASLEAVALRKSFGDAMLGGKRLKKSEFVVLHSMGEIGTLGSAGGRSQRSISAIPDFLNGDGKVQFWSYLHAGLPGGDRDAQANAMRMQKVKDHVSGQMHDIIKELRTAFSRPDKDVPNKNNPVPRDYASTTIKTSGEQLLKDWKDGIDLVIATGHGNWYKRLTEKKKKTPNGNRGFANDRTVSSKVRKALDYTEFVLLKWEIKQDSGNLRIMDGYAPGYRWYDLEQWANDHVLKDLARSVDYGDYGAFDDDAGYNGFEDYGYDDEDDAEYYGFDDYDDDDAFDEYDGEMNEYSIYEEAMKNLMRAKREFTAAKRLVMEDRRMRRKYIYN